MSHTFPISLDRLRTLLLELSKPQELACRAELLRVHSAVLAMIESVIDGVPLDKGDRELIAAYAASISDRRERPSGIDLTETADVLRPRHKETLEWLLTGATEKEIAVGLGLSVHTVHQYVKAIYRRFGVTSRAQLMASRLRVTAAPSC